MMILNKKYDDLKTGDIIFNNYPCSDGTFKKRPLIVLQKYDNNMVLVGYLTSVPDKKIYLGNYTLKHWKEAGLNCLSTFKADGVVQIKIKETKYWGHLNNEDFKCIAKAHIEFNKRQTQQLNNIEKKEYLKSVTIQKKPTLKI